MALASAILLSSVAQGYAHSGKARFHMIIDTDGAADDLRTLCMLLGNREAEVLAVTTSEGALPPEKTAACVASLLASFHHEGVPVGVGHATGVGEPHWRAHSERIVWGDSCFRADGFPRARTLVGETFDNEEEKIVYVALGALTNLSDVLDDDPAAGAHIERIVWYDNPAQRGGGANYRADSTAARRVLASGIPVEIVSANPATPVAITPAYLDSVAMVPTPYARRIVTVHRTSPLAELVDERHLEAWDDLVALYLYCPELFACSEASPSVRLCRLAQGVEAARVQQGLLAILRGKPDSESRVFYGFPTDEACYAEDVIPIIAQAVDRHGPSEWRAGVLTNELHGHLGIYATIGVKMGIRAREYFNIGVDDIEVETYAGHKPPVSCMNDGLQVGTGASVGHGLITVAPTDRPRPEARFSFKGKTIRLALKPEYADRVRRDVQKGVELYGGLTEPYWQYVRGLALQYWLEFDRHEIFDLHVEDSGASV